MRLGLGLGINKGRRASGSLPLPLDAYTAIAAYSVRYLGSSYTGDVIEVRETGANATSGFTPEEITDGTLTTFTGANNGEIRTWYDQSGNGNDALQTGDNANQPTIVSAGSLITENGIVAVDFDGTDDFLKTAAFTAENQPFTIVAVANSNLGSIIIDGGANYQAAIRNDASGALRARSDALTISTTFTQGNQILIFAVFNGANSLIAHNDDAGATGTIGTLDLTAVTLGKISASGLYADVVFQEVIVFDGDQTLNRTAISNEINAYYGIY